MYNKILIVGLVFLLAFVSTADANNPDKLPANPDPNRFEKDIRVFEEWDSKNSVPPDAILFLGSSTIKGWATHDAFPKLPVINRGFGGSHISDINYFIDRVVLPYKPALIVFYAGDNDIAAGKSPQHVLKDYQAFVKRLHERLNKTSVIFIAVKPSLSRWSCRPQAKQANSMIKIFSSGNDRLFFIDTSPQLLTIDGKPNSRLYKKDNLHLNAAGYRLWTETLTPILALIDVTAKKDVSLPTPMPSIVIDTKKQTIPPAKSIFVASKNSRIFHRPDCGHVKNITPQNLVKFPGRAGAVQTGRRPCKTCKP